MRAETPLLFFAPAAPPALGGTDFLRMLIYFKLLMTATLWGGTFVAGRMIAGHVDPASAAFLRFFIASTCLLLLTWRVEGRLPALKRRQILPVILLGLTGVFAYNIFFFKSLKLITAGRASLIIATNPIFITLLSAYFFKERLNLVRVTGILLSVTGAVVVISRGHLGEILGEGLGLGEIYILVCVLSWVAFSLIGKTVLSGLSPLVSIAYSSVVGTVALFFPAYLEGLAAHLNDYSTLDWLNIFYLGIFGTVVGFIWYYEGIRAIGPGKASLFINFVPVSAIILAFFILQEPVTFSLLVGAVMVSTGVYLTNSHLRRNPVPAVPG